MFLGFVWVFVKSLWNLVDMFSGCIFSQLWGGFQNCIATNVPSEGAWILGV